jgi:transcriptional regulator with XRE-family HTH domain
MTLPDGFPLRSKHCLGWEESSEKKIKSSKKEIILNRLAVVLKEERITNRALAEKLSYEEATVSKWATNAIQPPLSTFLRIALTLNRDLKDLFISTKDIGDEEKKILLKKLSIIAEKGKRTGKNKK